MFGFLDKITSGGNHMSFHQLTNKVRQWQDRSSYPLVHELPDTFTLSPDFTKRLIRLYKNTRNDEFERAISIWWADGDLVFSSVDRGNRVSITPRSSIEVRYVPTNKREYFRKEVYLEGKLYSKRRVYYKKIPKSIEIKSLFNIHTHPPHETGDGGVYYSFFSAQDIKSLIKSNAVLSGMVSDKVWFIFRTNQTPSNLDQIQDSQMNADFLTDELKIVVYSGDFKSKLVRYRSPSEMTA